MRSTSMAAIVELFKRLRFGPKNSFRVFYDVNHDEKTVSVLAIGVKEGNRLCIGGEEGEL